MFKLRKMSLIPLAAIMLSFSAGSLMAGPPHIETPGYDNSDSTSTPSEPKAEKPKPEPKPKPKPEPKAEKSKPKSKGADKEKAWWEW